MNDYTDLVKRLRGTLYYAYGEEPNLPDHAADAIEALTAERDATAWQDIATAPKDDRTYILAWRPLRGSVRIAKWSPDQYAKKPRPYWAYLGSFGVTECRADQPTHWKPLPAPPPVKP